ncbi:MAG: UvrD-helicase domain-containing protein [Patescibacteria group bacterium]|jgi:DNA helicase-2/ATP-dependent DNA helicase PcrA
MPFTDVLNSAQKQAVQHREGPLLIVAGAGTGKTTVITERIGWLIKEGLAEPHEILALTFTDKAAGEMQERVDQLLPYGYLDMWISTFHSFGERILQTHGIDIGLPTEFRLLTQTEQWMFIHEHLDDFDLDYYRPLGNPTKFIHALITHFSRLKDEHITPAEYLAYAESLRLNRDQQEFTKREAENDPELIEAKRIEEVANAYHVYEQLLAKSGGAGPGSAGEGALDFGSLITATLDLFTQRPNLLKKYREQFKFILVDEFQDTNWAQYEMVKMLSAPKNNLTVVGDDDQSIYKFRGASISNILAFKKDYPNAEQVVLTENYRSKQNILDLAYRFIQLNNPNRLEVQLTNGSAESSVSKKLQAAKKGVGIIEHIEEKTEAGEASAVVKKIIELKEKKTGRVWSDFAILVRANDHAQAFILALERAGVPYQSVTSRGLYRKPEVLDILNYLKLVDNYHESTAVWRVLTSRAFAIPDSDLITLNEVAKRKSQSLYETARLAGVYNVSETAKTALARFVSLVEKHTALARRGSAHEVAIGFLEDSGYMNVLTQGGRVKDQATQAKIDAINQFFRVIQDFERGSEDTSVRSFMRQIELEKNAGESGKMAVDLETGPDAVRVMTVHTAKGLEFPFVFLVNLVEQRFPTMERRDAIAVPDALVRETVPKGDIHTEEERRLFYVGITRAQEGVFFTSAKDYGGSRMKRPSQFLHELGLVEKEEAVAKKKTQKKPAKKIDVVPSGKAEPGYAGQPLTTAVKKHSFSSLAKYDDCPLKYKFAFVLKVPARGSHHFSFGNSVHHTLYQFLTQVQERRSAQQGDLFGTQEEKQQEGLPVSFDELIAMYEKNFIDDWYVSKKQRMEYFQKGKHALKDFYEQYAKMPVGHLALEQRFTVKIAERIVGGSMDRIDKEGEKVHIIDYKTGKSKDKLEKEDKRQLMLYAAAARDPHVLDADVAKVTYYYLEDGSMLSLEPQPEDYEDVTEWVGETAAHIESGDFTPTPGRMCRFCEYKDICDFADVNA